MNSCTNPAASGSTVRLYLNGLGATPRGVSVKDPAAGTVVDVEREPDDSSGVWTVRVQLPQNGPAHTLTLRVDGVPLGRSNLLIWVK